MTAPDQRELTALEMARNLAASVHRHARQSQADQASPYLNHHGEAGHAAAQLAANLALVSIAEDVHRIVAIMTGEAAELLDAKWAAEAEAKADEPEQG